MNRKSGNRFSQKIMHHRLWHSGRGMRLAVELPTWRSRPAPERRRAVSIQETQHVSTALVPVSVSDSSAHTRADFGRPPADFLAQLIATVAQVPQTRMRRRAEPAEAVAVYGAIERREAARRPALSRSL